MTVLGGLFLNIHPAIMHGPACTAMSGTGAFLLFYTASPTALGLMQLLQTTAVLFVPKVQTLHRTVLAP